MRRPTAGDLTALADGTLRPRRREALLRRVSASPKLARALKQQLVAVDAVRRLDTPAPPELRERIQRAIREACAAPQSTPSDAPNADGNVRARPAVAGSAARPLRRRRVGQDG